MKCLVTGGLGFIGSHLVDALIARGDEVLIIDHKKKDKPRFINEKARLEVVSFDDDRLAGIFEEFKPDVVFHLAAQISVPVSVENPVHDAQTNILASLKLLELTRMHNCKKFIFAQSGGAIYGDNELLPTPEHAMLQPISPYGVSKFSFEKYLESYHALHGLSYVALRLANVYGPRQMMNGEGEGGVIAIFTTRVLQNEGVTFHGNGSATRDFVYVDDVVRAFVASAESDFTGSVNVSTGIETSIKDLWNMLNTIHDSDIAHTLGPERKGDIKRSVLAPEAAHENIHWKAEVSMMQGLKETYLWAKERTTK